MLGEPSPGPPALPRCPGREKPPLLAAGLTSPPLRSCCRQPRFTAEETEAERELAQLTEQVKVVRHGNLSSRRRRPRADSEVSPLPSALAWLSGEPKAGRGGSGWGWKSPYVSPAPASVYPSVQCGQGERGIPGASGSPGLTCLARRLPLYTVWFDRISGILYSVYTEESEKVRVSLLTLPAPPASDPGLTERHEIEARGSPALTRDLQLSPAFSPVSPKTPLHPVATPSPTPCLFSSASGPLPWVGALASVPVACRSRSNNNHTINFC